MKLKLYNFSELPIEDILAGPCFQSFLEQYAVRDVAGIHVEARPPQAHERVVDKTLRIPPTCMFVISLLAEDGRRVVLPKSQTLCVLCFFYRTAAGDMCIIFNEKRYEAKTGESLETFFSNFVQDILRQLAAQF